MFRLKMIDLNSKERGGHTSYSSSSSNKWEVTRERMSYGSLRNILTNETDEQPAKMKTSKKTMVDFVTQPIIMNNTRQMSDESNDTAVRKIRNKFEDIKTKSRKLFSSNNYPHTQRIMNELTDTSTTSMTSDYNYPGLEKVAKWSKNSLSSSSVTSLNDSSKLVTAAKATTTSKSMQFESGSSIFFNVRPSSTFRSDENVSHDEHMIKKPTPIPEINENFHVDTSRLFTKQNTNFSIKLNYDHLIHRDDGASSPHDYADLSTGRFQRENTVKNLMESKSRAATPHIYQSLERPLKINIYSDLVQSSVSNLAAASTSSFSSISSNPKKGASSKPKAAKIVRTKMDSKALLTPRQIESDKPKADQEAKRLKPSKKTQQEPSEFEELVDNSQEVSNFFNKLKVKNNTREVVHSKPKRVSVKIKMPEERSSKPKKPGPLREFKYVILTDLKIGEGEFSETFQAYRYDLGPPLRIAAKRLKGYKENQDESTVQLLAEISVLSELGKHENVIDFLGVFKSDVTMYMIFEYADKGDLKKFLDSQRKGGRRDVHLNKLRVCYEIANGMEYVSSLDIVHKDLAARNILLDKDYRSKIADFGCCKMEFLEKRPIRWMAPESLSKGLFTHASDVWSFGVLVWEIYTNGMMPYPGMTDDEVVSRIQQWYRLYKPPDCPNEVYNLMLSCWKEFSRARPKFCQIKAKIKELQKLLQGDIHVEDV